MKILTKESKKYCKDSRKKVTSLEKDFVIETVKSYQIDVLKKAVRCSNDEELLLELVELRKEINRILISMEEKQYSLYETFVLLFRCRTYKEIQQVFKKSGDNISEITLRQRASRAKRLILKELNKRDEGY